MLAKADKLGRANGILVGRELGGVDDGLGGHKHGVHVDTGAQAGDVDAGADAAGGRERWGMDWMTRRSASPMPFWTSAEKPPR